MNPNEIGMTVLGVSGALVALSILVLVGAVLLRAAAKWAERLDLPFWSSVETVSIYTLGGCALGFVMAYLASLVGDVPKQHVLQGTVAPLGFLLQSAVISGRHRVSFGKGIKISIFMMLVSLLVGIAVGVVTIGIFSVMPSFN
jgi:hypothetical protein